MNSKELKKAIGYISINKKKIRSISFKRKSLNYVKKNFNWKDISNLYFKNYKNLILVKT